MKKIILIALAALAFATTACGGSAHTATTTKTAGHKVRATNTAEQLVRQCVLSAGADTQPTKRDDVVRIVTPRDPDPEVHGLYPFALMQFGITTINEQSRAIAGMQEARLMPQVSNNLTALLGIKGDYLAAFGVALTRCMNEAS